MFPRYFESYIFVIFVIFEIEEEVRQLLQSKLHQNNLQKEEKKNNRQTTYVH
mgnify:CR=1 FL=1